MQPMNTFDPGRMCAVHDSLNDEWLPWDPEKNAENYRTYATTSWDTPGVVAWGGMLLDGWRET